MRFKVKTGGGSGEVVSDTARHVQVKGRLPPRRIQEIKNHETGVYSRFTLAVSIFW